MHIGFVGKIGSGKDAAADYVVKKHKFVSLRLSDVISDELVRLGIDSSRENKQILGTKMRREQGEDILMRKLFDKAGKGGNYIFNGIRHPDEAAFLKKNGGILVKMVCDEKVRFERAKVRDKIDWQEFKIMDNRESERMIDKIKTDFSINNNGSLENLQKQLDKLIAELS